MDRDIKKMKCKLKTCKNQATKNPYEKGLFCSSRCALNAVRTHEHQVSAGKKGALTNIIKYRGTGHGYIKEITKHQHRIVMERKLGRKLRKGEIVHHIDHNKQNNSPDNLMVTNRREHIRIHGLHKLMKGKHLSDESKKKISESNRGKTAWNKGKTNIYSKQSLKKMSQSAKNRWLKK